MFEITGKHNKCKIFADNTDNATVGQITALMNQKSVSGSKVRFMPDLHAGKGSVIGTTMTIVDKVVPNVVGVDIGCGVLVIKLAEKRIDLPNLDSVIRKYVPNGSCEGAIMHNKPQSRTSELNLEDLAMKNKRGAKLKLDKAYLSCGSLGGGNHFIEVDKDTEGSLYLLIHSGSRALGLEVCNYYQKKSYEDYAWQDYEAELEKIKSGVSAKEREKAFKALKKDKEKYKRTDVPYELAYCEGDLLKDYLHDMGITQHFASVNRRVMADIILKKAKLHEVESFETVHNYIDLENMILRKGSVSAQYGEKLIIPMNMRDGCLLCIGRGNEDWNYSAPHGAGRILSRSEAKDSISMKEYQESMQGIYTTSVSRGTIDESPMVYKPVEAITKYIGETADILDILKPIYNFKAES